MLSKFLDPKNDFAFRRVFGSEQNKDILIHFLNDMIVFKENKPITEIEYLKTIQDPEIAAQKTSIVDILCKDELGNKYIVEMQVSPEGDFAKRAQYYAAKAYISQAKVKGKYYDLKEVIFIAISDFTMFPNKHGYKSDHVILDKKTQEHDLKDFSFTFLELPKFNKSIDELNDITDKWMYFFKHCKETSPQDLQKLIDSDQIMERAYHELESYYWNEEELLTYDQAEKYEWAYNAAMDFRFGEGLEEGLEKGREEGREEKKEIARKMLEKGVAPSFVKELTGFSDDDFK